MVDPVQPIDMNRPDYTVVDSDRLIAVGHPAGDLLEAHQWTVLDERVGSLRLSAHLPDQVLNPRGQLFGGFTATYVDLVALFTVRAGPDRIDPTVPRFWMATVNMRIDYFEPIRGPTFLIESKIEHTRGRTNLVSTRMIDGDTLAVHALTTLRTLPATN